MDPEPRWVFETTTDPGTLEKVQLLLDDVWTAHDIPELVRMHVDLAAGEIGANIIEHAGHGSPVRLRMEIHLSPESLRITTTDDGCPLLVDLSHVAMPDDISERGRGLAISLRVLDQLTYHRDNDGNHWTLVHRLTC